VPNSSIPAAAIAAAVAQWESGWCPRSSNWVQELSRYESPAVQWDRRTPGCWCLDSGHWNNVRGVYLAMFRRMQG
jgi:hypothetical protein